MRLFQIIDITKTNSTNTELLRLLSAGAVENWTAVFAHEQTQGRGQAGNTWETQPGKNIICSLYFQPTSVLAHEQFILSKSIALGIVQYLDGINLSAQIKWPNDIYIGTKKICGILIENQLMGSSIVSCIVGIGLNINQELFNSAIPNPTSYILETGKTLDPRIELEALLLAIQTSIMAIETEGYDTIANRYEAMLYQRDQCKTYKTATGGFTGYIRSVKNTGEIIIEDATTQEMRSFLFKEVEYCR